MQLQVDILSPSNQYMCQAKMLVLPGEQGVLGILSKHMNLIVDLKAGIIEVHKVDSTEVERIYISRGFAQVNNNTCTVIVSYFTLLSIIDHKVLQERLQIIEGLLSDSSHGSCTKQNLIEEMEYLKVQLNR